MTDINITEAKNRLTELVKEVETTTVSYSILRNGHKAAILLSAEEYESLLETVEVLAIVAKTEAQQWLDRFGRRTE